MNRARHNRQAPVGNLFEWSGALFICNRRGNDMEHKMLKKILSRVGLGFIILMVLAAALYYRDMREAYGRIQGHSKIIPSPYGDIEYTEGGAGPDVLVIHGAGGGFDQGEIMVQAVLDDGFHWIAPSRFGYLRSTFREGASWDDQAHAYAFLLDRLGIKKVAVVALSQGGPSALLFAVLHPERVTSLALISCGVASSDTADQKQADKKGDMLKTIYQYDPLYWTATKLFKKQFLSLMGAPEEVVAGLAPGQRKLAEHVIDCMNPVSPRSAGVTFDNKATMPNSRVAAIRAPTVIFHATDDTLQVFQNAEFAFSTIPGARLFRFERGGHLLMIVEQKAIRAAVQKHILDHRRR